MILLNIQNAYEIPMYSPYTNLNLCNFYMQDLNHLGILLNWKKTFSLKFNLFQISTSALPTLTAVMLMLFVKMYHDLTLVHVRQDFQEMETVAVVSSSPMPGVAESYVSLKIITNTLQNACVKNNALKNY